MGGCQYDWRRRLVPSKSCGDPDLISGKLNAGVLFFRNSAWTRSFLNTVWAMRHTEGLSEQSAMRDVLEARGEYDNGNKHFIRVPQFKMNSYPEPICREDPDRPWWPGDWIIHFPVSGLFNLLLTQKRVHGLIWKIVVIRLAKCCECIILLLCNKDIISLSLNQLVRFFDVH